MKNLENRGSQLMIYLFATEVLICPYCHIVTVWATHMAPTIFGPYGAHLTKRYHSHLAPMWVDHMGPISAHMEPIWGPETYATWEKKELLNPYD